ncbi:MAG: hypothetical protein ACRETL_00695 [Gammaproteobacteria bacterium]
MSAVVLAREAFCERTMWVESVMLAMVTPSGKPTMLLVLVVTNMPDDRLEESGTVTVVLLAVITQLLRPIKAGAIVSVFVPVLVSTIAPPSVPLPAKV